MLDLERNCLRLASAIDRQTYRPSQGRCFHIQDPKPRAIYALPFPDRVVQHYLIAMTMADVEHRLSPHSFACRTGKGTHACLRRARDCFRRHEFVLRLDIRKFFPSIDHEILREQLDATTPSPLRWLRDTFIDARLPPEAIEAANFYMPGDDIFTPFHRRHGLPIGSLTSQIWANVYLTPLDNLFTSALGLPTVRYCDDVLVFANDPELLRNALGRALRCAESLRLRLHPDKTRLHRTSEPVRFLGFVLRREGRVVRVRLHAENLRRMRRRVRKLQLLYAAGAYDAAEVGQRIRGWLAHASHGDTQRLLESECSRWVFSRPGRVDSDNPAG